MRLFRASSIVVLITASGLAGCGSKRPASTPDAGDDGGTTPLTDGSIVTRRRTTTKTPFELLADPYAPARLLPGKAHVVSSRQPEAPGGFGNEDFHNDSASPGDERVLIDVHGPGVVTRIWLTANYMTSPTEFDPNVAEDMRLRFYVDGAEVALVPGQTGVTVKELTSGTLPSFPLPWSLTAQASSGGYVITVPIGFRSKLRITASNTNLATHFYYQIDWRELPAGTAVSSFDGDLSAEEKEALATATMLWEGAASRGIATHTTDNEVRAGAPVRVGIEAPATVRRIQLVGDPTALRRVRGTLRVDGSVVVDAPLERWMFTRPPAVRFESALARNDATTWSFDYPFPVRTGLELELSTDDTTPIEVGTRILHDPGMPDDDLGDLRIDCRTSTSATNTNLTVFDVAGAAGQYAGQWLVVRGPTDYNILEGDHEVNVDGAYRVTGTGMEDYFGGGFYFNRGQFARPFHGAPGIPGDQNGTRALTMYRHHVTDAIPFDNAMAFEWEMYRSGFDVESCVYWYRR